MRPNRWIAYLVVCLFCIATIAQAAEVRKAGGYDISGGAYGTTWTDVRAYSIFPTNTAAVNTPLIQALLDNITAGTVLYFPAGVYEVNATLTISAKSYFRIEGAGNGKGQAASSIRWTGSGDNTATMLDLSRVRFAEFRNIQFMGNAVRSLEAIDRTNIGVYIHNISRHIRFTECSFYLFNYGVQNGHLTTSESNNDANLYDHCEFVYNGVGIRIAGANAIHNHISDCWFENNGIAVEVGQSYANGGPDSLVITNPDFSHSGTDIKGTGAFCNLTVIAPRTEHAVKFMKMSGANVSLSKIILINPNIIFHSGTSINPFLDAGLATLQVFGGNFGVLGDVTQVKVAGQIATFTGVDFSWPAAFTPTDNSITSAGKVTLIGCRLWDSGTASYKPMADGERFGQTGSAQYRFAANDNTPSVLKSNWFLTAKGTMQNITMFDDGYLGQKLSVVCTDNLTTFVHSSASTGLFLDGSSNWRCPSAWSNISFIRMENGIWVQDGKAMVR